MLDQHFLSGVITSTDFQSVSQHYWHKYSMVNSVSEIEEISFLANFLELMCIIYISIGGEEDKQISLS